MFDKLFNVIEGLISRREDTERHIKEIADYINGLNARLISIEKQLIALHTGKENEK